MNEPWVACLREQFPITKRTAFCDIAYENCGAAFVRERMEDYFVHKADVYPGLVKAGGAGKGETIAVVAEARERLARFLNAPGVRSVAFTENTTQGINLILQGFPFQPGDNIVVGELEHVAVLMPCLYLKQRGIEVRVARSRDGIALTEQDLLSQADERTRIIAASYVQSRSGWKLDLRALAEVCRSRGIYLVTDGIQALGFQRVDVRALGVDAMAASCYKGLLATEGVGFLYCADELLGKIRPVFAGDSPALLLDRERMEVLCPDPLDARKLESGTIPFQSIYGLSAGLERLMEIGMERVERHVSECYERVHCGLTELGYEVDTPLEPARRCHSMLVRTDRNREMVDFFLAHGVFFSPGREGYVRISVAPFTAQEDIDALLQTASLWLAQTR